MFLQILIMLGLTILQNASFTLVSRARNGNSILFHGVASVLSNGIWLLVIRHVVTSFDSWPLMITYVVGSVTGSILMHHISMKYLEKHKLFNKK
jgi:putative flippase GtrA